MTKYDANDHYVCSKSGVLKNKLNITNSEEFNDAESTMTAFRSLQLKNKPVKGNFDLKHLQAIHKYLFKEIYSWAGNIRNVDLAKSGSYFANHVHIESVANSLLTDLVIAQKYGTCFEAKTLVLRDFYPSIGHIKIPLIGHL